MQKWARYINMASASLSRESFNGAVEKALEAFSSAQKQPKQNASSQNREENGSTMLRNTGGKPLLAG